jgi:hypothetical protein
MSVESRHCCDLWAQRTPAVLGMQGARRIQELDLILARARLRLAYESATLAARGSL